MSNIRNMNQYNPFWDFVASMQNPANQSLFNQPRGAAEEEQDGSDPFDGHFGFSGFPFGQMPHRGRRHGPHGEHHGRDHPRGPPPHHGPPGGPHGDHPPPPPPEHEGEFPPPPPFAEDPPEEVLTREMTPPSPGPEPRGPRHHHHHHGGPHRGRHGGSPHARGVSPGGRHGGGRGRGGHGRGGFGGRGGGFGGRGGGFGAFGGPGWRPHGPPGHGPGPRHHGRGGRRGDWPRPPFDLSALAEAFMPLGLFGGNDNNANTVANRDGKSDGTFTPELDIFDVAEAYVLHLSLPGAKKPDLDITYSASRNSVTVSGVVHRPGVDEDMMNALAVDERKAGAFEREIRLEEGVKVDEEGISAKLEDGVLRVTVPKVLEMEDEEYVDVKRVQLE